MSKPNWSDKTIWTGDNLPIMRGLNSESVDLIYLDPPFNSKANYAAPIGSEAAGAEFKDTWTLQDVDVAWLDLIEAKHPKLHRVILAAMSKSDQSYLVYMAARLLEMHRLLKPTGSIYLHCDPTMSHYLKLAMDAVFGKGGFRNEIIWNYSKKARGAKAIAGQFPKNSDTVLWYSKTNEHTYIPQKYINKTPFKGSGYRVDEEGRAFRTAPRGDYTDASIERLNREGRVYRTKSGKIRIKYFEDCDGDFVYEKVMCGNVWIDISDGMHLPKMERTGYPTQKPLALLERIIKASSNNGEIVFDPFCGCATTLVAADRLQRKWVGIDISPKAVDLVVQRIKDDQGLFNRIMSRDDIPQRTDMGKLPRYNCTANKRQLYGEQDGNCTTCGTHFEVRHLEIDHIIARTKGGTDHIDNLQLLCASCNRIKGDRGQEYLLARLNQ